MHHALITCAALLAAGCALPYPIVNGAGPLVVPPHGDAAPLAEGARVTLLTAIPPPASGCRFLGLATGVGGGGDASPSDARYGALQNQAIVSLRNAVGRVGGTHATIDAEVIYSDAGQGISHVLVRGAALACP